LRQVFSPDALHLGDTSLKPLLELKMLDVLLHGDSLARSWN
jgi:hypothetical protein